MGTLYSIAIQLDKCQHLTFYQGVGQIIYQQVELTINQEVGQVFRYRKYHLR